jgi:hypothetical protein
MAKSKTLVQFFGVLLLVGAVLHAYGSISSYHVGSTELVWALSGSLAAALTAVLNLVRAGRPGDMTVAWITLAANISWAAVAAGFGVAIGNLIDPRALWHLISALALAAFSMRTVVGVHKHSRMQIGYS